MARIVIADSTNRYDGRSLATQPLGGTESSVCYMAAALARRGHEVVCHTNCDGPIEHDGVAWRPLAGPGPESPDVYVAVQHPRLLGFARAPKRRVIWMLWRPNNLRHYKQIARVWWYRPRPIFISAYQASEYSRLLPPLDRTRIVAHALPDAVRGMRPLPAPPLPQAIFASNPSRHLDWLIGVWSRLILPRVPTATLQIYGIRDYGHRYGRAWSGPPIEPYLPPGLSDAGRASLRVEATATREALWAAMRASRVMLYGSHKSEMFCLSVAEAQALGVPAVVRPIAVLPERVRDGETGFIRADDEGFAEAAVRLLSDDGLWRVQHEAALRLQQGHDWDEAGAAFERALFD
ncbi:MAG: glycosyltransferase [Alphaproteobacteria bacterium]|nr:glycosyltransferase [Alphaproteobacteria bacterium]